MSGHTETPWEAQSIDERKGARGERGKAYIIGTNQGGLVAATLPWPTELDTGDFTRVRDNAAFIVQACNAYDSDQRIIAELRAGRDELIELVKLFERSVEYEIRKSLRDEDDEGANLKTLTLNLIRDALIKAGAKPVTGGAS